MAQGENPLPGGTWQGRAMAGNKTDVDLKTDQAEGAEEPDTEETFDGGTTEEIDPYQDPGLSITREMQAIKAGVADKVSEVVGVDPTLVGRKDIKNVDGGEKPAVYSDVISLGNSAKGVLSFINNEFPEVKKVLGGLDENYMTNNLPSFLSVIRDLAGTIFYLQNPDYFGDYLVSIVLPNVTSEGERDEWKELNNEKIAELFKMLTQHWELVLEENKENNQTIINLKREAAERAIEKYLLVAYPRIAREKVASKLYDWLNSDYFYMDGKLSKRELTGKIAVFDQALKTLLTPPKNETDNKPDNFLMTGVKGAFNFAKKLVAAPKPSVSPEASKFFRLLSDISKQSIEFSLPTSGSAAAAK